MNRSTSRALILTDNVATCIRNVYSKN